jgi:hypothetical protein
MQVDTLGRTYIIHHTSYMSAHGLSTGGVAAGSGVWVHIIVFILVGSYDRMMWGACMDGGHHCLPCCRRSTLLAHTLNTHTHSNPAPASSIQHRSSTSLRFVIGTWNRRLGTIAKSGGFGLAVGVGSWLCHIDDWNVCLAMTARHRAEVDGWGVMV